MDKANRPLKQGNKSPIVGVWLLSYEIMFANKNIMQELKFLT